MLLSCVTLKCSLPDVSRWKRNSSGDKIIKDGKPVLEFVAIERRDCSEWALPGVRIN